MRTVTKLAIAACTALCLSAGAIAEQVVVDANKSVPLRINGDASSVVIGNPIVADVSVHNQNLIFITGRTSGTTNLLVFDEQGKQLYSGDVVVVANSANLISVNRAGLTNTYDCAPRCRSVLSIGDDPEYFDAIAQQNTSLQSINGADN